MGDRDIWKISRRPSSTWSYQGNMYILIATESARSPVKRARKFDLVLQSLSVSGTCSFCTFFDHQSVRIDAAQASLRSREV